MKVNAAKLAGQIERLLNGDDDLQSWSITRTPSEVKIVRMYRHGVSHTVIIPTSDPEFIHASL